MAGLPPRIGNFEVIRQIGSGGMGKVYLGRDEELNRQVAIKVIREGLYEQEILTRFFREARAAAALRHPNIITIYASGQHEQQPYIVMEFVDGESLVDIIRERRPLPLANRLAYIDQICAGLNFAHRAGIVHRDIKPANVMVDRDRTVRILDFGIARIEGSAMTQDGALIGSFNYMSPEQMLGGAVDHRSDIFSVGSLAYELLSYQQAFKGSLADGLLQRLPNEDPPPLTDVVPGLPPAIDQVVMRALQKAPDNRFQSLGEMRAALEVAESGGMPSPDARTIVAGRTAGTQPASPPSAFSLGAAADALRAMAMHVHGGADARAGDVTPAVEAVPAPPPSQASQPVPPPEEPVVDSNAAPSPPGIVTGPPGAVERPPSAVAKPPTTRTRPPSAVTKPPTTRTRPPAPSVARTSRKWIAIGAAVAVTAAAIVAVPRFTAQPSPVERERPRVVEGMERFRVAYRTRDLNGAIAVFPSMPRDLRQTMQRTFARCLVYDVTFTNMEVTLNPEATQAQADVYSLHECTPNSNERQTTISQRDVFTLRMRDTGWEIDSIARLATSASREQ